MAKFLSQALSEKIQGLQAELPGLVEKDILASSEDFFAAYPKLLAFGWRDPACSGDGGRIWLGTGGYWCDLIIRTDEGLIRECSDGRPPYESPLHAAVEALYETWEDVIPLSRSFRVIAGRNHDVVVTREGLIVYDFYGIPQLGETLPEYTVLNGLLRYGPDNTYAIKEKLAMESEDDPWRGMDADHLFYRCNGLQMPDTKLFSISQMDAQAIIDERG